MWFFKMSMLADSTPSSICARMSAQNLHVSFDVGQWLEAPGASMELLGRVFGSQSVCVEFSSIANMRNAVNRNMSNSTSPCPNAWKPLKTGFLWVSIAWSYQWMRRTIAWRFGAIFFSNVASHGKSFCYIESYSYATLQRMSRQLRRV